MERQVRLAATNGQPFANETHPLMRLIRKAAKHSYRVEGGAAFVVDITPDIALEMLTARPSFQRPINDRSVKTYASAMDRGQWRFTGDPIRIDRDMNLIDGQHRLSAVVQSDSGFVLRGATVWILDDAEVFFSVDVGRPRNTGDHLRWASNDVKPSNSQLAAIVYDHVDFKRYAANILSKEDRVRIALACPHLPQLRQVFTHRAPSGIQAGALRCMRADVDAACEFFGAMLENRHAINGVEVPALRLLATWYFSNRDKKYSGDAFMRECVYRSIRAWNAWRRGESIRFIRYSPDIEIPEAV